MKLYSEDDTPDRVIYRLVYFRAQNHVTKTWYKFPVLNNPDTLIEFKLRLYREGFDHVTQIKEGESVKP